MLNSLDHSINLYRRTLKKQPCDDEALMGTAIARFHDGNFSMAIEYADAAVRTGGPNTPFAAQTKIYLETSRSDFDSARDTALALARWAECNRQRIMAIDAYVLASNLSSSYLADWDGAFCHVKKARALIEPGDFEVAKRVNACERDLDRRCTRKKFGDG
jgi:tetratricopeptide (TPR) repeat protein